MKKLILIFLISFLLMLSSCKKKSINQNDENYKMMYSHLVDCWSKSLEGIHFDNAFYGDSRVIGGNFVNEFSDKSVINLGVGGDKISDLINRFSLIDAVMPQKVFLSIGGNDCLSSSYNIDKFMDEYRTLLDMFKERNIEVIIHNIVGITTYNSKLDEKDVIKANKNISEANEFIKEISEEMNYVFIDIASLMNMEGSNEMNAIYSADGVHFNEAGYKVWYQKISSFLV